MVYLIRVLCLNFIILAFSLIQQVILEKKIDFKVLSFINIAGSSVAGIIALFMAIKGFGVWAIIAQMLTKSFITSLSLWGFNKWRPQLVFSWHSLKSLFGYGSKLTLAGLTNTFFQYFYFNVIGKVFPVIALGYYTRAVQLQEFPVKTLASIFRRVSFPVFSSIQNDNERLRKAVRKTLRTMSFITFPILFGLIAVADQLIEVVLTEKWLPASGYLKLLCLMGLFYTFLVINYEVLKAKGNPGLVLNIIVGTKIIFVLNIFIAYRWGIMAIILGQILVTFITYLIGSYYVWKKIGYSLWQQIKDVYIYFLLSLIMFLLVMVIPSIISNSLIALVAMVTTGVIFYAAGVWFLKLEEAREIIVLFVKEK